MPSGAPGFAALWGPLRKWALGLGATEARSQPGNSGTKVPARNRLLSEAQPASSAGREGEADVHWGKGRRRLGGRPRGGILGPPPPLNAPNPLYPPGQPGDAAQPSPGPTRPTRASGARLNRCEGLPFQQSATALPTATQQGRWAPSLLGASCALGGIESSGASCALWGIHSWGPSCAQGVQSRGASCALWGVHSWGASCALRSVQSRGRPVLCGVFSPVLCGVFSPGSVLCSVGCSVWEASCALRGVQSWGAFCALRGIHSCGASCALRGVQSWGPSCALWSGLGSIGL